MPTTLIRRSETKLQCSGLYCCRILRRQPGTDLFIVTYLAFVDFHLKSLEKIDAVECSGLIIWREPGTFLYKKAACAYTVRDIHLCDAVRVFSFRGVGPKRVYLVIWNNKVRNLTCIIFL